MVVVFIAFAIACFTAGAGLSAWYYSSKVKNLNNLIDKCTGANASFKSSIENQNEKVLALNKLSALQAEQYKNLINKPEKVRFKTKYIEVKSNECEDIKNIIGDIRANGF